MARYAPLFAALAVVATTPAAAQWSVFDEEAVSLAYGPENNKVFSISCARSSSDVVVVVPPGIKPRSTSAVLTVKEGAASRSLTLTAEVCGGETTCTDRGVGEVYIYRLLQKGKTLPLALADRATAFSIDAPGAQLDITADRSVFARFAAMCRKKT
jgi:hypothetical protein